MATMVESLFGITPEMYQQAQNRRVDEAARQYAQMDPFERANYGLYRGASNLVGALGGMLGVEDPELQRISTRNAIARQIDYTSPTSIQQGIQSLAQAGDTVGAMQLTDIFRKLQSEQALAAQRAAAGQASLAEARLKEAELAEIKRQQDAFEREFGPTPAPAAAATAPTDVLGDFIQEQVARAEGRPVRGPAFELAAAAEPAGLAPAPAAAPAAAPAPAVKTRKAIEDEIAALQKRKARLSTFTKLSNAKDLASQLDTQIKALQDQIAPTEIGKLEREIEQFRAAGVPDTDQRIRDRRAKIDKLTGAAERFGTDREAISLEVYNKPFAYLTPDERAVVNKRVEAEQGKKAAAGAPKFELPGQKALVDIPGFRAKVQATIRPQLDAINSADQALTSIKESLDTGNFVSFNAARVQLAKSLGDSQLSRRDIEQAGGDPSLLGGFFDATSRLFSGVPTADTQRKIEATLNAIRTVAAKKARDEVNVQRDIALASPGYDAAAVNRALAFPELAAPPAPQGTLAERAAAELARRRGEKK